jgi:hypothetical protein
VTHTSQRDELESDPGARRRPQPRPENAVDTPDGIGSARRGPIGSRRSLQGMQRLAGNRAVATMVGNRGLALDRRRLDAPTTAPVDHAPAPVPDATAPTRPGTDPKTPDGADDAPSTTADDAKTADTTPADTTPADSTPGDSTPVADDPAAAVDTKPADKAPPTGEKTAPADGGKIETSEQATQAAVGAEPDQTSATDDASGQADGDLQAVPEEAEVGSDPDDTAHNDPEVVMAAPPPPIPPDPAVTATLAGLDEQAESAKKSLRGGLSRLRRTERRSLAQVNAAESAQLSATWGMMRTLTTAVRASGVVARVLYAVGAAKARADFSRDATTTEESLDGALTAAKEQGGRNLKSRADRIRGHEGELQARAAANRDSTINGARAWHTKFRHGWSRARKRKAVYRIGNVLTADTIRSANKSVFKFNQETGRAARKMRIDLAKADRESLVKLGEGHASTRKEVRKIFASARNAPDVDRKFDADLGAFLRRSIAGVVSFLTMTAIGTKFAAARARQGVVKAAARTRRMLRRAGRKTRRAIGARRRDVEGLGAQPGALSPADGEALVAESRGRVGALDQAGRKMSSGLSRVGRGAARELGEGKSVLSRFAALTTTAALTGASQIAVQGAAVLTGILGKVTAAARALVGKQRAGYLDVVLKADREVTKEEYQVRQKFEQEAAKGLTAQTKLLPRLKKVASQKAMDLYDTWDERAGKMLVSVGHFFKELGKFLWKALKGLLLVLAIIAAVLLVIAAVAAAFTALTFVGVLTAGLAFAASAASALAVPLAVGGFAMASVSAGKKIYKAHQDKWSTRQDRYNSVASGVAEVAAEFVNPPIGKALKPLAKTKAGAKMAAAVNKVDAFNSGMKSKALSKRADLADAVARRAERAAVGGSPRKVRAAAKRRAEADKLRSRADDHAARAAALKADQARLDAHANAPKPAADAAPKTGDAPTTPAPRPPEPVPYPSGARTRAPDAAPRAPDDAAAAVPVKAPDTPTPKAIADPPAAKAPPQSPGPDLVGKNIGPDELAKRMGVNPKDFNEFDAYAAQRGIVIYVRPANVASPGQLSRGAIPKDVLVKAKTVDPMDVDYLGAHPDTSGLASVYKPKLPKNMDELRKSDPDLADAIQKRFDKRMQAHNAKEQTFGEYLKGDEPLIQIDPQTGVIRGLDPRLGSPTNPVYKDFASDYDLFDLRMKDGSKLSPEVYKLVINDLKHMGLVQHGAHMNWKADVGDAAFNKPGVKEMWEGMRDSHQAGPKGEPLLAFGDGAPKASWPPPPTTKVSNTVGPRERPGDAGWKVTAEPDAPGTAPAGTTPSSARPTREMRAARPTREMRAARPTREMRAARPTREMGAAKPPTDTAGPSATPAPPKDAPAKDLPSSERPTGEFQAVKPSGELDLRVENNGYSTAVFSRSDPKAHARVKTDNGDLTIEYVNKGQLPPGSGHKLVAAAMRAEGMDGVKRIVSRNIIEPDSRALFEVGGQAADSKIAKMRTKALEELGITVGRDSHSWQMLKTGLELITKLP